VKVTNADGPDDGESEPDLGDWVGIHDKAWPRTFLLDHLGAALAETGHWIRDLTVVIMGAAFCEYYLRQLIALKADLPALEPRKAETLPFAVLVRMARALEVLPESVERPLMKFAHLRNSFAHDIEYRLSEADIKPLRSSLNPALRAEIAKLEAQPSKLAAKSEPSPLYARMFIATIVDELEKTLRGYEGHGLA
jgi:hypothetical protein